MLARDVYLSLVRFVAEVLRRTRKPAFACGECERWERCGMPPNERCIVMAAQLARERHPVRHIRLPAA